MGERVERDSWQYPQGLSLDHARPRVSPADALFHAKGCKARRYQSLPSDEQAEVSVL